MRGSARRRRQTQFGLLLALCLGIAGAKPVAAGVIYDFSLSSNGSVGAIDIQLTFDTFVAAGAGLNVYLLSGIPVSSYSSGTTIDASASAMGFEVDANSSLIGFQLLAPGGASVLDNPTYPSDFFSFARTANQTGTFTGTGNLTSNLTLGTATPTATLVVTDGSGVPEPATAVLLGLWLFGIACWRMHGYAALAARANAAASGSSAIFQQRSIILRA